MEVVAATPNSGGMPPFHDRDVREWSRLDSLTGVLERARLETDHWTAHTNNSSHRYNKVVDSRTRANADGGLQQKARRQLEVYQSQIPGGHLQVIKTHSVSTSRWSNNTSTVNNISGDFENLKLTLNPLDLSSQKSKVNIGKSISRRPPSRPRTKDDSIDFQRTAQETAAINLSKVSRLCHQIHENTVKQTFGKYQPQPQKDDDNERESTVEICEISSNDEITNKPNKLLMRTKSTSSEDLHITTNDNFIKSSEDLKDLEELQTWRRTSKLRRSLQYPSQNVDNIKKPLDLPKSNGNVKKIREELEKGRRLNTALRGNNVDLEALDQILQSISSSSSIVSEKSSNPDNSPESDNQKRNSFVTVESIQEIKGKLKRTSLSNENGTPKPEETDDGIETEESKEMYSKNSNSQSRVKSYIYGMENMLKKPITGTGSLESRSKLSNGTTNLKTEDWYNRRKSYGFEQMHNNEVQLKSKTIENESSTDSGIYKSSDINFHTTKPEFGSVKKISSIFNRVEDSTWSSNDSTNRPDLKSTTITIPIKPTSFNENWNIFNDKEVKRHSIAVDESKYVTSNPDNKFRRTSLVVNDKELDDAINQNRKSKKVEFCKTEVHFAAESGKVNIVETDEKPPPTNNFRRRRRNSGPSIDEFEKSTLPLLHFGDTTYEKSLLGVSDDNNDDNTYQNYSSITGPVTVNTKLDYNELSEDSKKETSDLDNIKGILKNKPTKPIPYHLGENESFNFSDTKNEGSSKWGVHLKPVKTEPSFWKSTVTLHNTIYKPENESKDADFRKLLQNLRPTFSTRPDLIDHQNISTNNSFVKSSVDRRSWSVADRVKLSDEPQNWIENKIYSTKVNFGNDGTTVISNNFKDKPNTWRDKENPNEDSNQIINKGLVVRIGHQDASQNSACTKTTTLQQDNTKTMTKITIDLNAPLSQKVPSRSHNFKSTSLILDTLKNENIIKNSSKKQLEVLKKLYEDIQSDSDVDKEVQSLLGENASKDYCKEDTSSIISGSWSKMKAYKVFNEQVNKNSLKLNAEIEKGDKNEVFFPNERSPFHNTAEDKTTKLLASPSLVGKNIYNFDSDKKTKIKLESVTENKIHQKYMNSDMVLRQPKKSEMTYFGVKLSPKPIKKEAVISDNKPDLLKHTKHPDPIYENTVKKDKPKEFDQSILEELTRAADEILQAVNGFTDDDQHTEKEKLDTILETKSWKKDTSTKITKQHVKSKIKPTSSTSSIESLSTEKHKANVQKRTNLNRSVDKNVRKKSVESTSIRATTKARRLQRANSREALFQSHGSSSEDLGVIEAPPVRKPRQIKKTKLSQLTITNGIEMNKKPGSSESSRKVREESKKSEVVRSRNPLPEIHHKPAVSTIRSIAEKSDTSKRRVSSDRKEHSRRMNTSSRKELSRNVLPKETVNHRISTASIKKCVKADGTIKT